MSSQPTPQPSQPANRRMAARRQQQQQQPLQPNWADKTLGCFSHVQPSPTLDHLIRFLSTWSGTDKALMITQYSSKLVVPFLTLQHSLRLRLAGTKAYHASNGGSANARRIEKLSALISDARILYRLWGILPMIKWMIALERSPPPTRPLHMIERIQGWSMIAYCPMEALAYLASHGILPISTANQNRLWLWSCRCWALYVGLQLLHLVEDNRLLRLRARALERSRGHPIPGTAAAAIAASSSSLKGRSSSAAEKEALATTDGSGGGAAPEEISEEQAVTRRLWDDLAERKQAILGELWVNLGYLPLTVHWSCPNGIFNSQVWVGLFGTIAAVAGLRPGWRATAVPP
ncbi:unnamed protein product [Parajaminaea phylloscopi]